jgi:hypothetical protein
MSTIRIRATGKVGAYCDCGYRLGTARGPVPGDGPRYAVSLGAAWHVEYAGDGTRVWRKSRNRGAPPATAPRLGDRVQRLDKPVQSRERVLCPKCGAELEAPH